MIQQCNKRLQVVYGNDNLTKNMVIIAYKDRPELFSTCLRQLLMESLGKDLDLNRSIVNRGTNVPANKSSTNQHSHIQQPRDALKGLLVNFVEVLADSHDSTLKVEARVTVGDFLHGFYRDTRHALAERDPESLMITMADVSARTVRVLAALFERSIGVLCIAA
jgi:glucose-6-phosphate isomerase